MAPRKSTAAQNTDEAPKHLNVYQALAAAQAEIVDPKKKRTAKVKTKTGAGFEYKYADLSDTLQAVRQTLPKHGLIAFQWTTINEGQMIMHTILEHGESGTRSHSSEYPVCSVHGDHQQMGAAVSYARRYALCMAVGISPAEDGDGELAAKSGDGERQQLSMQEAKKELNWNEIEGWIRSIKSHDMLAKATTRVKGNKGYWPASYINSAMEEINKRAEELDYMEKVHSDITADPSNLADLLDDCNTVTGVERLVETLLQVTELGDEDFALINARIEELK